MAHARLMKRPYSKTISRKVNIQVIFKFTTISTQHVRMMEPKAALVVKFPHASTKMNLDESLIASNPTALCVNGNNGETQDTVF